MILTALRILCGYKWNWVEHTRFQLVMEFRHYSFVKDQAELNKFGWGRFSAKILIKKL